MVYWDGREDRAKSIPSIWEIAQHTEKIFHRTKLGLLESRMFLANSPEGLLMFRLQLQEAERRSYVSF